MNLFKALSTVLGCTLLSACLQVELYGPVEDSDVTITRLPDGSTVQASLRTGDAASAEARWGEQWQEFSSLTRLLLMGTLELNTAAIEDDTLYLVTASGGNDLDYNLDGIPDAVPEPILGDLHAIVTGAQLKGALVRVNVLTEAVYQVMQDELETLDSQAIPARLDALAAGMVEDVNRDGEVDYTDVLQWSQVYTADRYRGPSLFLTNLQSSIEWGYSDSTLRDYADNIVNRATLVPARPASPYAANLLTCSSPVLTWDLCYFLELPLIGQVTDSPSIDDIMERTLVSHAWMATRFEQLLEVLPEDIRLLARSLTAIVIDANTRPAYYDPVTSTIYLDADFLWLTLEEYATVTEEEDYRADFGSELMFADLWRYVTGNDRAYPRRDTSRDRALADITGRAAALLYHELAHANDRFPRERHASLSSLERPYDSLFQVTSSDEVSAALPLGEERLFDIADVLFGGVAASAAQRNHTPAGIGALFAPDGASDLYAYYTQYEDFAMLFEEYMLYRNFGFRRDLGFTSVPTSDPDVAGCDDYVIGWGKRGRVGESHVRERLGAVLARVFPDSDFSAELALLPPAEDLPTGQGWCEHLDGEVNAAARPGGRTLPRREPLDREIHWR